MQQNQYLITAPFVGLPDDIQAQIAHGVFELSQSVMKHDLAEISMQVSRYYNYVFDIRWMDEFAASWQLEVSDECNYLFDSVRYDCLRYIEHVRNYKAGYTTVPAFDKTSSKVMNIKTQRAAAIKNLERLKNVLNEIFDKRQAQQREKYETDTRRFYPGEDHQALYEFEEFVARIEHFDGLKQTLIDNINDAIAEFRQSLQ
mgnify:CR=1 FL=1